MKSAAEWFAELPAPPDPGLVDQQYRVITLEQIAAIQLEGYRYAQPEAEAVRAAVELQRRQLLAICTSIIQSRPYQITELSMQEATRIVDWALGACPLLYPAGDSQPHLRTTPAAEGDTGIHMETPPG